MLFSYKLLTLMLICMFVYMLLLFLFLRSDGLVDQIQGTARSKGFGLVELICTTNCQM